MSDSLFDFFRHSVSNDFISDGVLLGIAGGFATVFRRIASSLANGLASRLLPRLHVPNRSPMFTHLEAWQADHPATRRCHNLIATTPSRYFHAAANDPSEVILVPGHGGHLIREGLLWLWVWRQVDTQPSDRRERESITLTALTFDADRLHHFVNSLGERYGRHPDALTLYTAADYDEWEEVATVSKRPLASVSLPDGLGDRLREDARCFLTRRDWYASRGIPWRRGYLFYGPPGTGKTSLVRALASELDLNIAVLDLASERLDDGKIRALLGRLPPRTAVVVEDIDTAAPGRDAKPGKLTLSGLLNALDGLAAGEGRLLFLTSNRPEALDAALLRPGRVDMQVEIGPLRAPEIAGMVARFHPGRRDLMEAAAQAIGAATLPAAEAQDVLLATLATPDQLAEALRQRVAARQQAAV